MRHLKLTLVLLLIIMGFFQAGAQNRDVVVKGHLTADTAYDYENIAVTITMDSALGGYQNTVLTNSNGYYIDTIPNVPSQSGDVTVSITDCYNQQVVETETVPPQGNPPDIDPKVCAKPMPDQFSIYGTVKKGGMAADQARAYLYELVNNNIQKVDSTDVQNGDFAFEDVDVGLYFVIGGLLPSSPDYSDYMPTYHQQGLSWLNADTVDLNKGDHYNVNVNLHSNINTGGQGFISGYVTQGGPNKKAGPGDPVKNAQVTLTTENDEPVAFKMTDGEGFYEFPNLTLGTYKLWVEIPGKPSEVETIELSNDDQSASDINFEVDDEEIVIEDQSTSVESLKRANTRFYPNPVTNQMKVTIELAEPASFDLTLNSSDGRTLYKRTVNVKQKQWNLQLDMEGYPKGVYFIRLQTGESVMTKKVIKQ